MLRLAGHGAEKGMAEIHSDSCDARHGPGSRVGAGLGVRRRGVLLIEQGLKAVLHVRGVEPPKTHALSVLFEALPAEDQGVLRAYYNDFRHTFPGMTSSSAGDTRRIHSESGRCAE